MITMMMCSCGMVDQQKEGPFSDIFSIVTTQNLLNEASTVVITATARKPTCVSPRHGSPQVHQWS